MELKGSLSDYTEFEFKRLAQEIIEVNGSEQYQNELLYHFNMLAGDAGGTDLIFYPKKGADCSAEGIIKTVSEWCEANGLPGFKPRF